MTTQKLGLLLVNHGSHSETWRNALLDLEARVRDSILAEGLITGIKTAHMEYTEPSIASQMKAFDAEGFTDVVIVPIFLTVSPHSLDDIPTIIGQKDNPEIIAELEAEKIERYKPAANVHLTPLLDFSNTLPKNVLRRARNLSRNPEKEGLVLIGYGDATFDKEWGELFSKVAEHVKQAVGISEHSYGWCGHIAHYNPDETTKAINRVLDTKEIAIVIPVLVAYDQMFQKNIIGRGIANVENHEARVVYEPDAILPDPDIENWVISITSEFANKLAALQTA
ncbi:MAG: CbiX/SirB N-terminal domain-containing protein [Armatimonadetes bacterium]|nr:CbiX/SirB N-terminal domain-containing protein [Armatimonadota bacterium]